MTVVFALPVLSACASNFNTPVMQEYNPGIGINDRSSAVEAYNVVAVTNGSGEGTLVASLLNRSDDPDRLTGAELRAEDGRRVSAELAQPVQLPPGDLVQLHEQQAVTVSGNGLRPGFFLTLTLRFERADPVSLRIPTEPDDDPYEDVPIG